MKWKENLVKFYLLICEDKIIQNYLKSYKQSNNQTAEFTDEEALTLYLFGISEGMSKVNQIHRHSRKYLSDWFPKLPQYQGFNERLNKLSVCFELPVGVIIKSALPHLLINKEKR